MEREQNGVSTLCKDEKRVTQGYETPRWPSAWETHEVGQIQNKTEERKKTGKKENIQGFIKSRFWAKHMKT